MCMASNLVHLYLQVQGHYFTAHNHGALHMKHLDNDGGSDDDGGL